MEAERPKFKNTEEQRFDEIKRAVSQFISANPDKKTSKEQVAKELKLNRSLVNNAMKELYPPE